ncbi:MAG TPA: GGDEF domain-containing protein, partial [Magnetovibrio sp.]
HLAGDEAIQRIAQATRKAVRESDIVCRWGGEEFAVLASHCNQAQAVELSEKIRAAIKSTLLVSNHPETHLTASAGVAEAHEGDDANTLLARSDKALYQAKELGRDRVEVA